jgi:hypothetical protein
MSNIQSEICRTIIDTSEVMQMQVATMLVSLEAEGVKKSKIEKLSRKMSAKISKQSDALVDRVIKALTDDAEAREQTKKTTRRTRKK